MSDISLIYIHGFNSSPQSWKAGVLRDYFERHGAGHRLHVPGADPIMITVRERPYAALANLPLVLWISLANYVKRWHDVGKSGWWVLICLIPCIGPLWQFVELGFSRGTYGPNHYGPDPT